MLIHEWMSKDVLTMESTCSIQEAIELFHTRIISMIPVFEKRKLVGVITDGDIKKASPSDVTSLSKFEIPAILGKEKVETIMSKPVITVRSNYTVPEAAHIMLSSGINGLPTVDRYNNLVGIITKSDIFRCIVSFMGASDNSQIFGFMLKDEPGMIKRITDRIREGGGRIGSVMTTYDKDKDNRRKIFIYAFGMEQATYEMLSEEYRNKECLLYAADLPRRIRELYSYI
jgi:acetoin utilization protein AcuB